MLKRLQELKFLGCVAFPVSWPAATTTDRDEDAILRLNGDK